MAILKAVDPDEIDNLREGRRGRVAYPILKSFLEMIDPETQRPLYVALVNHEELKRTVMSLSTGLSMYIKAHGLPLRVFQRSGKLYICRLDVLRDGTPDPDYKPATPARALKDADIPSVEQVLGKADIEEAE